jgi:hypothetical protein
MISGSILSARDNFGYRSLPISERPFRMTVGTGAQCPSRVIRTEAADLPGMFFSESLLLRLPEATCVPISE